MTAFEILYAHLKAMNYKDAPLLVDGKLLFLNVGENYHILYLDDTLFVVDFVNSVIQHYRPNDKKLSVEKNRSIDYLRTLDKIPDTFLDLMPAYLYYQELSGQSQSRQPILTIWPEATKFDFIPPVYSSGCSTSVKYDIKELFLNTAGWVARYSNKAKLDKNEFGTTHYHFDLRNLVLTIL